MSTTTAEPTPDVHEHAHGHPSDRQYVFIALALAALTALEVSTYFVDFGPAHIPVLMVLMVIKFGAVAAYFMHLKFDSKIFMRLFAAGLVLAVGVYIIFLTILQFWTR